MLQGTSSNVGKSVLAAALCRIFKQDGYSVVPFKSQNMALNSFVTRDGGEMGRAQVVQAEAAGISPAVEMNPILLKPTGNASSQVIVLGKPVANMGASEYHLDFNMTALGIIEKCLCKFHQDYEVIVIEGAGSPAEVNLKPRDIANMRVAKMAQAPVLLVADIDRGGALASVVGTLELLDPDERRLVAGIIINKFRGDISLLQPAVDFLEEKTGKPVLGIVPYFKDFRVPEEDSVVLETRKTEAQAKDLDIAVIALPRISNFTDFDALEDEPDVGIRYVTQPQELGSPDLIVIPGSKNTIEDLLFLHETGLSAKIKSLVGKGVPAIGICGGYQILGEKLLDPQHTESLIPEIEGLGLIPMETTFVADKVTCQVTATSLGSGWFLTGFSQDEQLIGYEIHMGRTRLRAGVKPAFLIKQRSGRAVNITDGAVSEDGQVLGTYIHGIFDNDSLRRHILNKLRARKGLQHLAPQVNSFTSLRQRDYDRLAQVVRESLNMPRIYEIMGLEPKELRG